jgi:hypothetical protein
MTSLETYLAIALSLEPQGIENNKDLILGNKDLILGNKNHLEE